ncbi:protein RGF1 INDUCIBLE TRANSCRIPTION FACTOR 1-like [Impatiens glandulifera]|uniref:protein RGF1 INDUCIBLE TRANSCRIPTION FACTOR 1-like n=1 Tax=Impatiens glandulifera TaxID=253017 RepID=UPI001FB09A02|nr:protein RGF1 INDUCIBLE TRANSCRIPTION FACTOR 1-like [Impatiens glandulifera]
MAVVVPPWLEPLLKADFFIVCRTHRDAARSECNMFCLDCNGGDAFCFYCRSSKHKDHQVIQIRRSSYHDVVRVSEIQKVLDISGVQTYVINSARVLFLNERPQPKGGGSGSGSGGGGKTVSHICEICGRTLLDTFRFCSLGCKVVGIKRNGDTSFTIEGKNEVIRRRGGQEGEISTRVISSSSSSRDDQELDIDQLREGLQQDIYPPHTPSPPLSITRRRKGIPHRAPFGS